MFQRLLRYFQPKPTSSALVPLSFYQRPVDKMTVPVNTVSATAVKNHWIQENNNPLHPLYPERRFDIHDTGHGLTRNKANKPGELLQKIFEASYFNMATKGKPYTYRQAYKRMEYVLSAQTPEGHTFGHPNFPYAPVSKNVLKNEVARYALLLQGLSMMIGTLPILQSNKPNGLRRFRFPRPE